MGKRWWIERPPEGQDWPVTLPDNSVLTSLKQWSVPVQPHPADGPRDRSNLMWPLMEAFCVTLLRQSTSIYFIMNLAYVILRQSTSS